MRPVQINTFISTILLFTVHLGLGCQRDKIAQKYPTDRLPIPLGSNYPELLAPLEAHPVFFEMPKAIEMSLSVQARTTIANLIGRVPSLREYKIVGIREFKKLGVLAVDVPGYAISIQTNVEPWRVQTVRGRAH